MDVVSLNHLKGKVAVVTGASAGIGAAIVEALVARGLLVVGLARRKDKLDKLAEKVQNQCGKFYPLKADVSKEVDIVNAFKWIKSNVGPVHVLINNAGVIRQKGLIDGETKTWKEILDTNVLGLCIATREAVQQMNDGNISGHIIHMNSVAGHTVPLVPNLNVYPASKWAVTALTETLRHELYFLGSKIKITSISPGLVETEIMTVSGIANEEYAKELFKTAPNLKSEDIADSVIYVLATPPHVQIHELVIKPVGEQF